VLHSLQGSTPISAPESDTPNNELIAYSPAAERLY
jgi:hypothetical protein